MVRKNLVDRHRDRVGRETRAALESVGYSMNVLLLEAMLFAGPSPEGSSQSVDFI